MWQSAGPDVDLACLKTAARLRICSYNSLKRVQSESALGSTKVTALDVFLALSAFLALIYIILQIAEGADRFFSSGSTLWLPIAIQVSAGVLLVLRTNRH